MIVWILQEEIISMGTEPILLQRPSLARAKISEVTAKLPILENPPADLRAIRETARHYKGYVLLNRARQEEDKHAWNHSYPGKKICAGLTSCASITGWKNLKKTARAMKWQLQLSKGHPRS